VVRRSGHNTCHTRTANALQARERVSGEDNEEIQVNLEIPGSAKSSNFLVRDFWSGLNEKKRLTQAVNELYERVAVNRFAKKAACSLHLGLERSS
jgi:hypothetical protein